jgi:hypothetical protein
MFIRKRFLGLIAVAIGIAVAAALPSRASRVEATAMPIAIKGDRLDIRSENPTCVKASWPYGCGFQAPAASRRHRIGQQRERSSRGVVLVSTWKRQLAMPSKRVF